jgi:hypothetical protein
LISAGYANPTIPGISCSKCRAPGMKTLSAGALMAGRKMLSERLDGIESREFDPAVLRELTKYLLDLLEHQIERKLKSRELLEGFE